MTFWCCFYRDRRVRELGGRAYMGSFSAAAGLTLPGGGHYKYFGAAKDLPGVRELFKEVSWLLCLDTTTRCTTAAPTARCSHTHTHFVVCSRRRKKKERLERDRKDQDQTCIVVSHQTTMDGEMKRMVCCCRLKPWQRRKVCVAVRVLPVSALLHSPL